MKNEKTLVIVESPNKIKAIKKYLEKNNINCDVEATKGHIAILPSTGKDGLGIDIENWIPLYKVDPEKRSVVAKLKKLAKLANKVVIATDHDREGEAIAENLIEYLDCKDKYSRIVFNEITQEAIINAYNNPGLLNEDLVNAQKARRMLDRILGYKLTNLMKKNIKNSVSKPSAGRVQSIALKLVCDKEKEIESFIPEQYYLIKAHLANNITANYFNNELIGDKERVKDKKIAENILNSLKGDLKVVDIKTITKNDPIITPLKQATLFKKCQLSSTTVQACAQKLYEGFGEDGGIISYPRTDSTRFSASFIEKAKDFIAKTYGEEYVAKVIKGSSGDQDAHEAIRPTSLKLTPKKAKEKYNLTSAEYTVYKLIYNTTLKALMLPPKRNITTYIYNNNNNKFKNSFSSFEFEGYKIINDEKEDINLDPKYAINDLVKVNKYTSDFHETKPPARYTEGSLISMLDEIKVGRPSTFATTVQILKNREYAIKDSSYLKPTTFGKIVNEQLIKFFPKIINEKYTAFVENELDLIANEGKKVSEVMNEFNNEFTSSLEEATKIIEPVILQQNILADPCPICGAAVVERKNKKGDKFGGCSSFPNCKFTISIPKLKHIKVN
ncbi:type I DNA topoisomerase [Mycoplasma phocimorsus]|uniref:type I DNA topoisomerase n=1 Tax=Mycoplasma phocimorsus TaxID=3045839 RepID=UPI0024C0CB79|nr:type I DNA topoisomerase [Mycoplasma phocimorsus]MDJ1646262.1 type I DNA topoisomerase [Mycoplasma phocimorsus]MDJ1648605.1 type I DNA topoisomerase [Mycoplasma phocimorsus]